MQVGGLQSTNVPSSSKSTWTLGSVNVMLLKVICAETLKNVKLVELRKARLGVILRRVALTITFSGRRTVEMMRIDPLLPRNVVLVNVMLETRVSDVVRIVR